jgi:ribosomal protein S18 acetylase RimI-like enzyme
MVAGDLPWADAFLGRELSVRIQARRGALVDVLEGDGMVAEDDGNLVGIVTWLVDAASSDAEIRALAVSEGSRGYGFGAALMTAAAKALRDTGARRAWLVTTNDNLAALALYQKVGWRLSALRPGAVDESRRTIKPTIAQFGEHGIPLRDELELELDFEGGIPHRDALGLRLQL